jgi:hypothetical protein
MDAPVKPPARLFQGTVYLAAKSGLRVKPEYDAEPPDGGV